jgi:hypothetical protein
MAERRSHRCLRDAFKAPPVRHSGQRLLRADHQTGRQPALFYQGRGRGVLSIAGLWDRWKTAECPDHFRRIEAVGEVRQSGQVRGIKAE